MLCSLTPLANLGKCWRFISTANFSTASMLVKDPDPHLDADGNGLEIGDTNYLAKENGGKLRPGVILECRRENVNGATVGAGKCWLGSNEGYR
jgi:hypothetical protein